MLRINPRLPLLWRTPHEIQIVFASAAATIRNVSEQDERLITTLHDGVSAVTLSATAQHLGVRTEEVAALLEILAPALESPSEPRQRVMVSGTGRGADWLSFTLREAGQDVSENETAKNPPDLVVVSASMVAHPLDIATWLQRDVPHLIVTWMDTAVDVGPLVVPGVTACWYCVELTRAERDNARRALLTQVSGRPAAAETLPTCLDVSALVARWVSGDIRPAAGVVQRCDARTGKWSTETFTPHEACSCRTPQGNVTAPVTTARSRLTSTKTEPVSAEPE